MVGCFFFFALGIVPFNLALGLNTNPTEINEEDKNT